MPLMSVVLPAPLSPTSAVTFPAVTSKETLRSTCTAPKLLLTPRRLSSGSVPEVTGPVSVVVIDTAAHWTPYLVHNAAYDPAQTLLFGWKPSAITVLTPSWKIACGVASAEGTSLPVTVSLTAPVAS